VAINELRENDVRLITTNARAMVKMKSAMKEGWSMCKKWKDGQARQGKARQGKARQEESLKGNTKETR